MSTSKKLSNAYTTGGGGVHFEAHVQAAFVALMLSGGRIPYFSDGIITEIKPQGKIAGYDVDDCIVKTTNLRTQRQEKLLCQIKSSVAITKNNKEFIEVIQAAWNDFNNPQIFTKGVDKIAMVTGPISAQDTKSVQWLLEHARHTKDYTEFFININTANFCSDASRNKLNIIRELLNKSNQDNDVEEEKVYSFLNHFCWLGYDLGHEDGVAISLLLSHIAQFESKVPRWLWSRIIDFVMSCNQTAGTITKENIPEDILDNFKICQPVGVPTDLALIQPHQAMQLGQHPDATLIALILLLGSWNDKNKYDQQVVSQLLGISYADWQRKAQDISSLPNSPLSINKSGTWKISNREKLWSVLASRFLDINVDAFKELALAILTEHNPAFELPAEERYAASIHNKNLQYSDSIRVGITEGWAILANNADDCIKCTHGKIEACSIAIIKEIFSSTDWTLWGSLNDLLPILAEVSPPTFLECIEKILHLKNEIFETLFAQEGSSFTGQNYLTGLLWALERLAWDKKYIVRVALILAKLDNLDPGGQWANRPLNSLVDILLPWHPQTTAPIEKRKAIVSNLFEQSPDFAWKLMLALLPDQYRFTTGTSKPKWILATDIDHLPTVNNKDYLEQSSYFIDLAITHANLKLSRLASLFDFLKYFQPEAFDQFLLELDDDTLLNSNDKEKQIFWEQLTEFIQKHQRYSHTDWALPAEKINSLMVIADKFTPTDIFILHKQLFAGNDFNLMDDTDNYEIKQKVFYEKRENIAKEIFSTQGLQGILNLNDVVTGNFQVGIALDTISDTSIEQQLIPDFLLTNNQKQKNMLEAFINCRYKKSGIAWVDNFDKLRWSKEQVAAFFMYLPFMKEIWDRVNFCLDQDEKLYWENVDARWYDKNEFGDYAVNKLLQYKRPLAAIDLLYGMLCMGYEIDVSQCIDVLVSSINNKDDTGYASIYHIEKIIGFVQKNITDNTDVLIGIEFAYIKVLQSGSGLKPKITMLKMSKEPSFFCDIIKLIYRSKSDIEPYKEPTENERKVASNAWSLLHIWDIVPGTQDDGTFDAEKFNAWLGEVKSLCEKSGHLDIALNKIGEVLIHAPTDPSGLWIHKTVAAALDEYDNEIMRSGYSVACYNSRGVFSPDPEGAQEKALADKYNKKAEDVENAGYIHFASTLRKRAKGYELESKRAADEYKERYQD